MNNFELIKYVYEELVTSKKLSMN